MEQQPRQDSHVDIEFQAVAVATDAKCQQREEDHDDVGPDPTCESEGCPADVEPEATIYPRGDVESLRGSADQHVVNIEPDEDENCCVVCTEPLKWVAVGQCGHRLMCPKCMVRLRFFNQNTRCCFCQTPCSKVIVVKVDSSARDDDNNFLSKLPLLASLEGPVGNYWYNKHTQAYFVDEQEYKAARAACKFSYFRPLGRLIWWFGIFLFMGVMLGTAFALDTNHRSTKVRAYAVCISITMLLATLSWPLPRQICGPPRAMDC